MIRSEGKSKITILLIVFQSRAQNDTFATKFVSKEESPSQPRKVGTLLNQRSIGPLKIRGIILFWVIRDE